MFTVMQRIAFNDGFLYWVRDIQRGTNLFWSEPTIDAMVEKKLVTNVSMVHRKGKPPFKRFKGDVPYKFYADSMFNMPSLSKADRAEAELALKHTLELRKRANARKEQLNKLKNGGKK